MVVNWINLDFIMPYHTKIQLEPLFFTTVVIRTERWRIYSGSLNLPSHNFMSLGVSAEDLDPTEELSLLHSMIESLESQLWEIDIRVVEIRNELQWVLQVDINDISVGIRLHETNLRARRPAIGPQLLRQKWVDRLNFWQNRINSNRRNDEKVYGQDKRRDTLNIISRKEEFP